MKNITGKKYGILLMCTSSLLFSGMQIAIRLTAETVPLMQQVFFRNIVSLVICFCIIKKTGGSMFGEKKHQPLLFTRSVMGLLGLVSLFYAASNGYQADITIMSRLSPFLITLWAFLFLKEKIAKIQIPALLIAFTGALFVVNPVFNTNIFPLFIAFLCSVFSSISYTILAYFKNKVDPITVVMHFSTFCVAASLPFFAAVFVMPSLRDFILLLVIGTFGGFGQFALTYAYRMAPASEVSVYNYSGILFSALLGYFFLAENMAGASIIGGVLVVLASYLVYRFTDAGN